LRVNVIGQSSIINWANELRLESKVHDSRNKEVINVVLMLLIALDLIPFERCVMCVHMYIKK